MMQLGFTKAQVISVVKVGLYIGVSALLDYLISQTTGSQFGVFTGPINFLLVTAKKFVSVEK